MNRSARNKAIAATTGVGGGVAFVEGLKQLPEGLHPLEQLGLDPTKAEDVLKFLAVDSLASAGIGKGAEAAAKNKRLQALQKTLKKKGIQALAKTGASALASGPLAPAMGLGAGAYSIYDIGRELINQGITLDDVKNLGLIGLEEIKPKTAAKRRKKKAKEMKARGARKPKFRQTKEEILKSVGRKTGGKVGKPKGVGCAVKGYGKAMTRG